jgi:lipid-binding SYLF domain-containing protein
VIIGALGVGVGLAAFTGAAEAASGAELDASASAALKRLYASSPRARELSRKARAILVFPRITKAGFVVGGEGGDGVLREGGRTRGYYRIVAASFGFQAGVQTFGYVLFLITKSAVDYLHASQGWTIGAGPSVVVVDQGFAKSADTTTLTQDVYAMAFSQKGLMGGLSLEGSKITQIHPKG